MLDTQEKLENPARVAARAATPGTSSRILEFFLSIKHPGKIGPVWRNLFQVEICSTLSRRSGFHQVRIRAMGAPPEKRLRTRNHVPGVGSGKRPTKAVANKPQVPLDQVVFLLDPAGTNKAIATDQNRKFIF